MILEYIIDKEPLRMVLVILHAPIFEILDVSLIDSGSLLQRVLGSL